MNVLQVISRGLRQALSAPKLLLLLWLVNLLAALPAAVVVGGALKDSFGESRVAVAMERSFDLGWYGEYEAGASGLAATFSPALAGPGVVLDNLEGWWSGELFTQTPALVVLGVAFALFWAFLLGGVLTRLARPAERFDLGAFAGAGGRYFPCFVQLTLLSGVLYFLIYRLGRWLYETIETATRDVTVERTVLLLVLLAAALVIFLLCLVRVVFDYAKVAAVVHGERRALRCLGAGARMVRCRPLLTLGVYFGFAVVAAALLALYAWIAPGVGPASVVGVALAFLLSQLYLAAKLTVRVGLLAGELGLYQLTAPR